MCWAIGDTLCRPCSNPGSALDGHVERTVSRYHLFVTHVVLSNCPAMTNRAFAALGECRNIQSIRAHGCAQFTVSTAALIQTCICV